MRYGFFTTLAEPDHKRPYAQIIRDLREQTVFCDQVGFETVWLAEHHFGPEGMGNIPNPILLAARSFEPNSARYTPCGVRSFTEARSPPRTVTRTSQP